MLREGKEHYAEEKQVVTPATRHSEKSLLLCK